MPAHGFSDVGREANVVLTGDLAMVATSGSFQHLLRFECRRLASRGNCEEGLSCVRLHDVLKKVERACAVIGAA